MSQSLSPVFMGYVARRFMTTFLMVVGGLMLLIYLMDSIELMRRLSKMNNFSVGLVLEMAFFKLPEVGLELFPFAVLIAGVLAFWRLNRNSELVVARATGVSAWQFLLMPIMLAFMLGCLKMGGLHPLSAMMLGKYEQLEARYLTQTGSAINLSRTGLWLRQRISDDQIAIIHAQSIKLPEWRLTPVTAYFFDNQNNLTHRIDSTEAILENKNWSFINATSYPEDGDGRGTSFNVLNLPTTIKITDIESRFSSPRTISFWNLPEYARILHDTGFESNPLWAHYYSLLAEPVLNIALVFLAAALTLRAPRQQKGWWLVGSTIGIGFLVFFLGDFLKALGISDRMPLVMTAFAPAAISLLLGLTALLYLEDG